MRHAGFTLIELLMTTTIVLILAGIALATFKEYQTTAYRTVALSACLDARTSIESGRAERDDADFFAENVAAQIAPDGSFSCTADGCTQNLLFPNFQPTSGVTINANIVSNATTYYLQCGHCKNLVNGNSEYYGYTVPDAGTPSLTTFAAGAEISQCGVTPAATPVPTATPTPTATPGGCNVTSNTYVSGDGCCNWEESYGGSVDCPTVCGDGICEPYAEHYSSSFPSTCPADCGTCGDGICDGFYDTVFCSWDCPDSDSCGNGICEGTSLHGGENSSNCPSDCPATTCGDGVCSDYDENTWDCPADCPAGVCGDGTCDPDEAGWGGPSSCPADCY